MVLKTVRFACGGAKDVASLQDEGIGHPWARGSVTNPPADAGIFGLTTMDGMALEDDHPLEKALPRVNNAQQNEALL